MAKKLIADRERFFKHIAIEQNGCWLWQRAKDWDGYGLFKIYPRMLRAHRWAYEEFIGPIADGLQIDHLCRNKSCVNPDHLEVVTPLENTQRGARHTNLYCKNGHSLFGENLYIYERDGGIRRACRTCNRINNANFRRRAR
jgi:HNH endonuclease